MKLKKFIDKIILPSLKSSQTKSKRNEAKISKQIIQNLILNIDDLKDVVLDTYETFDFAFIQFADYNKLINDLKGGKSVASTYKEDGIWKDIMLDIYKVTDSKAETWFLVVDITNSPNIGLRDYWKVIPKQKNS